MPTDVDECVLISDKGLILEGLTTNIVFLIPSDGPGQWIIKTAETDVLEGTMLKALSRITTIPIIYEAISINELESVKGCFLTSMGRGVAIVESIRGPNLDIIWSFDRTHAVQTTLDSLSHGINSIFWRCTTNREINVQ